MNNFQEDPLKTARELLKAKEVEILGNPENSEFLLSSLLVLVQRGDSDSEAGADALVLIYEITNQEADPRHESFISDYYHPYNKIWQVVSQIHSMEVVGAIEKVIRARIESCKETYHTLVLCRLLCLIGLVYDRRDHNANNPWNPERASVAKSGIEKIRGELPEGDIVVDSYVESHEQANPLLMMEFLSGGPDIDPRIIKEETMWDFPMGNIVMALYRKGFPVLQANCGHLRGSAVIFLKSQGKTPFLKVKESFVIDSEDSKQTTKEKWLGIQVVPEGDLLKIKYLSIMDLLGKLDYLVSVLSK